MSQADLHITVDQRSAVPLYEQICQQIRRKIESKQLKPGMPLPTNHELRARLQVNYKTAQQAMATLAKEGYVSRQARRGTVVKGIPRRGVAAIYSHVELFGQESKNEYYRLVTGYLTRQLASYGRVYRMYLGSEAQGTTSTACEDLLRHLSNGTLCGILLVNNFPALEELTHYARALRIPVVSLSAQGEADYSVCVDLRGYVRAAAAHLWSQGRRRVGVVFNSVSPSFHDPSVIGQILNEVGFSSKESWFVGRIASEEAGYEAALQMPLDELDALIVEDDVMALGVDRRLCELNINVPRDLMVTTFWNKESRLHLTLPFEKFEFDVAAQARLSLQLMQDAINGQRIIESHMRIVPGNGAALESIRGISGTRT